MLFLVAISRLKAGHRIQKVSLSQLLSSLLLEFNPHLNCFFISFEREPVLFYCHVNTLVLRNAFTPKNSCKSFPEYQLHILSNNCAYLVFTLSKCNPTFRLFSCLLVYKKCKSLKDVYCGGSFSLQKDR